MEQKENRSQNAYTLELLRKARSNTLTDAEELKIERLLDIRDELGYFMKDLSPEFKELLLNAEDFLAASWFKRSKLEDAKTRIDKDTYSLTLYAKKIGKSTKVLAKVARELGFDVKIDRNKKYDSFMHHTYIKFEKDLYDIE